ncbi:MAG: hypothetical protein JW873_01795 [Candidatus Saganbacteria bacterium]|nr:hypothetical protein [Candidatus Saganbacteria bacterium]
MLIDKLNSRIGQLLPRDVKLDLRHQMAPKGLDVSQARNRLLNWVIGAMPQIAGEYGVMGQDVDGIQHYRFGFVQAEKLIAISKTDNFSEDAEKKMVALFTAVHDLGRMMVGSGASKLPTEIKDDATAREFIQQGNFLHPIAGAMMLREAFEPLAEDISNDLASLLKALVTTAERHTLSIGLMTSALQEHGIDRLNARPYFQRTGSLLMADAYSLGEYGKYAHLVALADLINNPSVKGLLGITLYDSQAGVETMGTEERIDYLTHGPGTGNFQVVKRGEREYTSVERIWRNKPARDNVEGWQVSMRRDATQFLKAELELSLGEAAFAKGWSIALGSQPT